MIVAFYGYVKIEKRVLIVDNNKEFADILYNNLLIKGYRNIETVNSYKDALAVLERRDFDIILMDIFAPELKGFEYVQEITRLRPGIRTFLMMEPELQRVINGRIKGKFNSHLLLKSDVAQNLQGYLKC